MRATAPTAAAAVVPVAARRPMPRRLAVLESPHVGALRRGAVRTAAPGLVARARSVSCPDRRERAAQAALRGASPPSRAVRRRAAVDAAALVALAPLPLLRAVWIGEQRLERSDREPHLGGDLAPLQPARAERIGEGVALGPRHAAPALCPARVQTSAKRGVENSALTTRLSARSRLWSQLPPSRSNTLQPLY